uniref:Otiwi4 n=1 Tax=Oxytricha trifallax TaxID=94289 RepID=H2DH97_OXYTR|nr:Otiwi4 [Sterkiella histriomuscorum]
MESKIQTQPRKNELAQQRYGRPVTLFANYFEIQPFSSQKNQVDQPIQKYMIKIVPEIPQNSQRFLNKLLSQCKKQLQLIFCSYTLHGGWTLFSKTQIKDDNVITTHLEDQEYKVIIDWIAQLEKNSQDYFVFIKASFMSLMKAIRFEQIGRNCFDSFRAMKFNAFKMEIWPGFDIRLIQKEGGVFLNIEPCHKVIRYESALEYLNGIRDMCDSRGLDFQREISQEFRNTTVITRYNNKPYEIREIDFSQSPLSLFEFEGKEISYIDYYKLKYNEKITEANQPLLIHANKRTGQQTFLIPELCRMTGVTDQMFADFKLMKEVKSLTHSDAPVKVKECQKLFRAFGESKTCRAKLEDMDFKFIERPLKVKATKYDAGNYVLGVTNERGNERIKFDIESNGRDLDRKTQCKMYDQPAIQKWGIFFQERDSQLAKEFLFHMEKNIQQFGYPAKQMASFVVKGNTFDTWRSTLMSKLDSSVQCVVLILPGHKDRCQLYDEIKRMLLEEVPVVSQVVLTSTLNRGRNLRSIISKILIQICAKIGGIPWTIDDMPIMDRPTMICGMDVFHKTKLGKKSVLAFCSSFNKTSTKYWSKTVVHDVGVEISSSLQMLMEKALRKFQKAAGCFPERIILYRDGVGDKQLVAVSQSEIQQIMNALKDVEVAQDSIKLMYINVCKRINTRLFAQGEIVDQFKNPIPGVVVNTTITERDLREFYLVSCQSRQGMVKPTRYTIIHDTIFNGQNTDMIEMLTYKLCHTYFNVAGSISIPAPVQYAHKLAALVGERGTKEREPPQVHMKFEDSSGLYFI